MEKEKIKNKELEQLQLRLAAMIFSVVEQGKNLKEGKKIKSDYER